MPGPRRGASCRSREAVARAIRSCPRTTPCGPLRSARESIACVWSTRRCPSEAALPCPRWRGSRGSPARCCSGGGEELARMPELSVVVPAFRERDNIPALLRALDQALEGLDWETIIVVDDAFDGSEDLVRERAQQDRRVRCIHRIGRRGLASACIEGMLASSAPYLAVIDADLQHDETLVPKLLEAAKRDSADIVVASRYMEGGSTGALAAERVRASRAASALSRVICRGLTDPMSGFFVVRRGFLERVVRRLYGRGFKILLDLVAAARGQVRIVELPYRMRSRQRGESKLGARVIAEFFMLLLYHLTGRLVPARFFLFAAVGVTGVAVQLAVLSLRSEEHTSELQSQSNLVCRLLLEKKKKKNNTQTEDGHTA